MKLVVPRMGGRIGVAAAMLSALGLLITGCTAETPGQNSTTSATPGSDSESVAPRGATIRENIVTFHWQEGRSKPQMLFLDEFRVTKGQPWDGVKMDTLGNPFVVTVQAGRKKTWRVATWFNDNTQSRFASSKGGDKPGELNFAIKIEIRFEGRSDIAFLGQGKASTINNWWFGSAGKSDGKTGRCIRLPNTKLYVANAGRDATFKLRKDDPCHGGGGKVLR